jgi:regulator of cell morphogenesis and NO signaling
MYIKKNDRVGAIVTRNVEAASIFNSQGIDFYSRGQRTIEHACLEDHAPLGVILEELWDLKEPDADATDFEQMDLADLSFYILRTHHQFAEKKVVYIRNGLDRFVRENELSVNVKDIIRIFDDLSLYLTVHMKHEEFIVFPYIQKVARSGMPDRSQVMGLEYPIAAMRDDHLHEVATLKRLASLTNNYTLSSVADIGLQMTYSAMKELEEDLKVHMHLENNILFPRTISFISSGYETL